MSRLTSVADAILTEIDGASFAYSTSTITTIRRWLPYAKREELGDGPTAAEKVANVLVIPVEDSVTERLTREKDTHQIDVEVFVQRAVDWTDNAMVDETVDFAEEVLDVVKGLKSIDVSGIRADQLFPSFEPAIVRLHLTEYRMFTSRITTRWKMAV